MNLNTEVTDALPDEVAPLIKLLIEGRVLQMVLLVELDNGTTMDCMPILDGKANMFAMVGALEVAKRDYMRLNIQSRVPYYEAGDDE